MATIEEVPEVPTPQEETAAPADKATRNDKKSRQAMAKLGFAPVPEIFRATLKQNNILIVVSNTEAYKNAAPAGQETYAIFGETTFEDQSTQRATKAAKNLEETAKFEAPVEEVTPAVAEDDENVDLQGLDPKEVEIVMKETKASKAKAVAALKKTGDIVSAVLELSV
ncbi:hypothetical protein CYY_005845 [Polysphondylium violaceum]|uniref:NAC-A/B domain-containing protein n=1 Tax=Polysphondylium violaceum TaxID=133409 RepID=A0A8J4PVF4_9MYCE|nr:hypothetical protein CYY_005845 [Polysphondylium violaceum]